MGGVSQQGWVVGLRSGRWAQSALRPFGDAPFGNAQGRRCATGGTPDTGFPARPLVPFDCAQGKQGRHEATGARQGLA